MNSKNIEKAVVILREEFPNVQDSYLYKIASQLVIALTEEADEWGRTKGSEL